MRMLRFVLMMATCGCLGAQTAAHFRITGTVVNDRNGEPIPFCHVTAGAVAQARGGGLQRGGQGGGFGFRQDAASTEADAKGRFTLEMPGEGRYRLSMSGNGFRMQPFEAHDGFSTAIVLTKETPVYAVVFRATSDVVILGQVTDDAGEAVRNAQVRLYSVGGEPAPGMTVRRLQRKDVAMTDDRGRYEFQGMPAGKYEVSVAARPWYATPNPPPVAANGAIVPPPDPSLDVVFPLTWYPGTEDEGGAEKIEMKYGERRQLDFRLLAVPGAHLLLDLSADQPASGEANARAYRPETGFGWRRNVRPRCRCFPPTAPPSLGR